MRASTALWVTAAAALGLSGATLLLSALIRFGEPARLWGVVLVIALTAMLAFHSAWRRVFKQRLGHAPQIERLAERYSARRRTASAVLAIAAAWHLVIAAAMPQWGEKTRTVRRQGIDVVFAIDISRSMLADDVAPDRLRAASAEIDRLLHLLEGDRVGLVVFAGVAFVQTPLTSDYGAIRLYLDRLDPEDLPVQGTAIGRAITEAQALLTGGRFKEDFHRAKHQIVVVFSDGEDTETDPVSAARLANAEGILVYTVGVGTAAGARIPIRNPDGSIKSYFTDRNGQVVQTRLTETQLQQIAQAGGGEYALYSGEGSVAGLLREQINAFDKEALDSMLRDEYEDRYFYFLLPGVLLLLLASFIHDRRTPTALAALLVVPLLTTGCRDALLRPDPRVNEALALEGSGQVDRIRELMDSVPREGKETPQYEYAYGYALERAQQPEQAQPRYLQALNAPTAPEQVAALVALGNTLAERDLLEPAIERYERALTLDPTHEGARRNLEIALRRLFPPCLDLDDAAEDNDEAGAGKAPDGTNFKGRYLPPGIQQPQPGASNEEVKYVSCGGDADWFAIPIVPGAKLNAEVRFTRLREDTGTTPPPETIDPTAVRISIFGPDGQAVLAVDQGLAESSAEGGVEARTVVRHIDELVIDPGLDSANYYLKVEVDEPLEYNYDLTIEIVPPCWAIEDQYESNDTPTTATAGRHGQIRGAALPGQRGLVSRARVAGRLTVRRHHAGGG